MKSTIVCLAVTIFCLLQCSVNGVENQAPDLEFTRSGTCNFTQECLYKYHTVQYTLGEKDRKKFLLSTDVHWHCESSGSFGAHPANEYCFTLSNTNITSSAAELNSSVNIHYTTNGHDEMATILKDKLKGKFCYVQTRDGKIVSVHYSPTESEDGINVKRGIAGAFQANFDNKEEVEELDPGSTHISHYSFLKTSSNVISFTRAFKTSDLVELTGGAPTDSLNYTKVEKSTFINQILYSSRGMLESKIEFGHDRNSETSSSTFNPKLDFGKEFEANGTYVLEKIYCKQRSKRSLAFADLTSSNIQKGSLKAIIDLANIHRYKLKNIRSAIPSIPGFLEEIRRNPNNKLVSMLQNLLKLEATYGTPSQYKSTIDQLINYYKQIQASNKPEDIEMRKILYTFFSVDSSQPSQNVLGSALRKKLNEDEQNALLRQLALITNASLDLVNTVISHITNSDDDIVPVLGALARTNNFTIQKVVIDELLARLNTALSSSDNEAVTTIIYALGNSGSRLAVPPLLYTLQYDDIDIQISTIRGLASHLDQPVVQQAIITLLSSTDEDKILEEILKMLIDAFEYKILTNPSKELISAIINSAIYLENPNLYELVTNYLRQLKNDEIDNYLDLLKQQHNYGDVQHEQMGDMDKNNSRVKRGSDWDASNGYYNLVATLSDRRNDVKKFPKHLAYIWGTTLGASNMNMEVGAGAFAGIKIGSSSADYKLFARVGANVYVFGRNYKVVNLELSRYSSDNYVYDKLYLWDGSSLNKNIRTKALTIAAKKEISAYGSLTIFNADISIYVYVGHVSVGIRGRVSVGMDMGLCGALQFPPVSQPKARCHAKFRISLTMNIDGDAHTTLLNTVEVGVEVSSRFRYTLYPELKVEANVELPDILDILDFDGDKCLSPLFDIKNCAYLSHSYNIDVEVEPWYKKKEVHVSWRGVSISWGPRTRCCGIDWSSSIGKTLLLSACPSDIKSCF